MIFLRGKIIKKKEYFLTYKKSKRLSFFWQLKNKK